MTRAKYLQDSLQPRAKSGDSLTCVAELGGARHSTLPSSCWMSSFDPPRTRKTNLGRSCAAAMSRTAARPVVRPVYSAKLFAAMGIEMPLQMIMRRVLSASVKWSSTHLPAASYRRGLPRAQPSKCSSSHYCAVCCTYVINLIVCYMQFYFMFVI
jgi:hypothetical protein